MQVGVPLNLFMIFDRRALKRWTRRRRCRRCRRRRGCTIRRFWNATNIDFVTQKIIISFGGFVRVFSIRGACKSNELHIAHFADTAIRRKQKWKQFTARRNGIIIIIIFDSITSLPIHCLSPHQRPTRRVGALRTISARLQQTRKRHFIYYYLLQCARAETERDLRL